MSEGVTVVGGVKNDPSSRVSKKSLCGRSQGKGGPQAQVQCAGADAKKTLISGKFHIILGTVCVRT
jgi:hypothetical protein